MDERREIRKWLLGQLGFAAALAAVTLARGLKPEERTRRSARQEQDRREADQESAAEREQRRHDEVEREAQRAEEERRKLGREALWSQPHVRAAFWSHVYDRFEGEPADEEFVRDRPPECGDRSAGRLTSVEQGDILVSIFSDPRDGIYKFEYRSRDGSGVGLLLDATYGRDEQEFANFVIGSSASAEDLRRVAQFLSADTPLRMSQPHPVVLARTKPAFATAPNGYVDPGERALFLDQLRRGPDGQT